MSIDQNTFQNTLLKNSLITFQLLLKYPFVNATLTEILNSGGIAVLPTDTIYGIHASALNPVAVEKIYQVKDRLHSKPMIILISSIDELARFGVEVDENTKQILQKIWPNPVSVILPTNKAGLEYLHRGTNSLAFRIPNNQFLLNLLKETGPLASTSANPEGEKPSETIKEAKKYFGDSVDYYLDHGQMESVPSTVIKLEDGQIQILRQGIFNLPDSLTPQEA